MDVRILDQNSLEEVNTLSRIIFNKGKEDSNHKMDLWEKMYASDGLLLGAYIDGELVGFLFSYVREKGTGRYHLWMGGVLEKYRRKGAFSALYKKSLEIIKSWGYAVITGNTFPTKFNVMWDFLQKKGFTVYKKEKVMWDGKEEVEKYYCEKKLE